MNYQESLNYLLERLPMFQRVGKAALKKDLGNTLRMLEALNNPQNHFKSIHIAGTNGKGTSAHAIASIVHAAGHRVGLYTSPHLKSFTERIRVNGQEVDEDFVSNFVTKYKGLIDEVKPSFFEVTVVMAFEYFKQQEVEIAVIETGLGGRLDSTNVITPIVSLITMIGFDHMDLLGDTLEKIAMEKAGIIKEGVPVVIGNKQAEIRHVFSKVANERGSILYDTDEYEVTQIERSITNIAYEVKTPDMRLISFNTDITAKYFALNISGILKVISLLSESGILIPELAIREGFAKVKELSGLKGRMQVIRNKPMIIADVSHNESGMKLLMEQVVNSVGSGRLHIIFGVVKDKDLDGIFKILPKEAFYYWTTSRVPRSLPAEQLKESSNTYGFEGSAFENVNKAILKAEEIAKEKDIILICGSTFVVAEIDDL